MFCARFCRRVKSVPWGRSCQGMCWGELDEGKGGVKEDENGEEEKKNAGRRRRRGRRNRRTRRRRRGGRLRGMLLELRSVASTA